MQYKTAFLLSLLFVASSLTAQNWVEQRTYFGGGVATPRIDGLFTSKVKGPVGDFVWMQVQQNYSQAYVGLTYSPKPWAQVALGVGLEQDKHPARVGSYLWLGKGPVSGLLVCEDGGSGFWYKLESNYQLSQKLGVGTLTERFRGSGPKVELSLPHTRLKLWGAGEFQTGSRPTYAFGVRWRL